MKNTTPSERDKDYYKPPQSENMLAPSGLD